MFASTDENKNEGNPFVQKQQPSQCRDPLFAVLFYVNLGVITAIATIYGRDAFNSIQVDADDAAAAEEPTLDFSPFLQVAGVAGAFGFLFSCATLQLLMMIPGTLIKVALITDILLAALAAAAAFYFGATGMGIFALIIFAITCCYTWCIWDRIPFATANLKTGCTAVKANCGVTVLGYVIVVLALGWTILWVISVTAIQSSLITCEEDQNGNQVCSNPNYLYSFLLFVSYFFTHQVLKNTLQVTIAGVIGTWWFIPEESGFCGKAVLGSFWRAVTTSFGSICYGSLLVAIIEATRQIVEQARQNEDIGNALACCIDCILGIIESLVEYFNKWAYIYVGLYGYGYCEAGKSVMDLFRDRGWEAIIADDIISSVLGLMSLVVGLITAGISVLVAQTSGWFDVFIANYGEGGDLVVNIITAIFGFILGCFLCSIIMGVILSSVNSSIVLFAEAPAEFETNHPELSHQMREAYSVAHPGTL